jgi:hypothetical protein
VQRDSLVGLPHEHCATLCLGVHRDDTDAVVVLGIELTYRPDQAYCGLASIDNCYPCEHSSPPYSSCVVVSRAQTSMFGVATTAVMATSSSPVLAVFTVPWTIVVTRHKAMVFGCNRSDEGSLDFNLITHLRY